MKTWVTDLVSNKAKEHNCEVILIPTRSALLGKGELESEQLMLMGNPDEVTDTIHALGLSLLPKPEAGMGAARAIASAGGSGGLVGYYQETKSCVIAILAP